MEQLRCQILPLIIRQLLEIGKGNWLQGPILPGSCALFPWQDANYGKLAQIKGFTYLTPRPMAAQGAQHGQRWRHHAIIPGLGSLQRRVRSNPETFRYFFGRMKGNLVWRQCREIEAGVEPDRVVLRCDPMKEVTKLRYVAIKPFGP
jgi:hypothetical protein